MTQDDYLIFEAYKNKQTVITENVPPTEAGESFGRTIPHGDIDDDTTKYMKQIPSEHRSKAAFVVISQIKNYISKKANKIYLGTYEQFRGEIANIIRKEFPGIDKSNALYSARKIQEFLVSKGIIKDERGGKLRVAKGAAMISTKDIEAKFQEAQKEIKSHKASKETSATAETPTAPSEPVTPAAG